MNDDQEPGKPSSALKSQNSKGTGRRYDQPDEEDDDQKYSQENYEQDDDEEEGE